MPMLLMDIDLNNHKDKMELSNTTFGQKRRLVIAGINSWDHTTTRSLNVVFYVQILDDLGNLIEDLSISQNRRVIYSITNNKWVNAQFDPVQEGTNGAFREYDYFFSLCATTPILTLVNQLADKLNQRGIFN